jgi:hypothetical protein
MEIDPGCREAHLGLLSLWREQGLPGEVLESYERLAHHARPSGGRFRCRGCGHVADEPSWRCPACRAWATPERLMPRPSVMSVGAGEVSLPRHRVHIDAPPPAVATRDTPLFPARER